MPVLTLDLKRRMNPDRILKVDVLVAGEQQQVFVDIVMPLATSLEDGAPNRSLAEQLFAGASDVVKKALTITVLR